MTEELKVNFQYQGNKIIIQCRGDEKMKDIVGRFKTKIGLNSNDLIFLCHGTNLNFESTFNEEIKDEDKKNNEINVVVEKNDNSLDNNETIKSKNIICPICKENCRMCIINYKIILFECKNGHKTNNILLEEFDNKQQINEYYITCDDCDHENKGSSYNHKFFKCLTCKKKLGILCKEKHRKEEHKIIEYDKKDYICEIHNDYFYSYCQDCRLNLCMNCYFDHKDHNIFEYQIIILILFQTDFKRLRTISVCPNTEQKVKSFPGKNFETNAVEKPKKPSNKKINDFQKNKTKRQSAKEIESSIKKLKEDEKLGPNEIILEYKKGTLKDKIIKIFGEKFVSNNRNNCSIKFDDKTLELKEKLELPKNYKNEENLKIKLIANNLTDMSYMFHECTVLTSIGYNSTLDTSNVTNMSYMFYNCNSLTNLSCISKWITSNVTDISYMFYSCSSLKKLPDISNWDTAKVTTLDNLFEYCTSLSSLPDISKWNISNVTTINYLFADCQSLISLPDISKWNTSNVTHMNYTFSSCEQLKSLPDISSWDISNVEFKYNMFGGCTNLKNIPSKFK